MSDVGAGGRALVGMCLGNLVELYDFAAFGASAAVLALVLTPGPGGLTSVFVVLAAGLLIRPAGGILIGRFSDRRGRRVPFLVMTLATCAATAAVGLLPSAATAGAAALLGLVLLRCLQAFCTGGETSTSVAYVFESAPTRRRGLYGGLHLASSAVGISAGVGAVLLVQVLLTSAQLRAWGWRLPFLAALPLGMAVLALRSRLAESAPFLPAGTSTSTTAHRTQGTPRRGGASVSGALSTAQALASRRPRTILSGALLGGAFNATVNLWFVYLPAYLLATGRAGVVAALGPVCVGLLACAALSPFAGAVSDRLGRPPVLIAACAALCLLWPVSAAPALAGHGGATLLLATLGFGTALAGFVLASHLPEAFAPADRATGVGLTFGVGSGVLGAPAPLLAAWLIGNHHTSAVALYPVLCAALAAAVLIWSRRTAAGPWASVQDRRGRKEPRVSSPFSTMP